MINHYILLCFVRKLTLHSSFDTLILYSGMPHVSPSAHLFLQSSWFFLVYIFSSSYGIVLQRFWNNLHDIYFLSKSKTLMYRYLPFMIRVPICTSRGHHGSTVAHSWHSITNNEPSLKGKILPHSLFCARFIWKKQYSVMDRFNNKQ